MIVRFALAIAALSLSASAVLAADAMIGTTSVKLPAPRGFCELSDKNPSDARMRQATATALNSVGNQLLGMSADCQQLTDWRSGARKLLDDISQYQTTRNGATTNFTPDQLKLVCETTRSQGEKLTSDALPDARKAVEEAMKSVKINEMRFVGVLDEDSTACYTAILQKIKTEVGTDKTQLVLNAITAVKAKPVFYYLISVYQGSDTPTVALSKHKANVKALLAANSP